MQKLEKLTKALEEQKFSDEAMEELPDKLKQVIAGPGEEDIFVGTKKALKKVEEKVK